MTRDGGDAPLWGGRFERGMASDMERLNLSLDVDRRLWREDVRGSVAWARALGGAGVLTPDEVERLTRGLSRVAERIERDGLADAPEEDIHSVVERMLREEVGDVAGKLHTGRSRNDQSATDTRLWGMAQAARVREELLRVAEALHGLAERGVDHPMPGYTHLQRAQPVRAAQWALAHLFAFLRDLDRLRAAGEAASVLPLGSGALAGCPFPVDREALRAELGFRRVSESSLDAVSDRDWMCDLAYAGAMIGVHLSRLSEDLVLFTSAEFGFLRLSDEYSTGSSLMPQKRNPDVAELARGKSARLVGSLTSLLVLVKGLPTGYNRDLQEDKAPLFDTVDTLLLTLPAVAGALRTAEFRPEAMREALDTVMLATDLADHLVRRGVPVPHGARDRRPPGPGGRAGGRAPRCATAGAPRGRGRALRRRPAAPGLGRFARVERHRRRLSERSVRRQLALAAERIEAERSDLPAASTKGRSPSMSASKASKSSD
jgi:argininosuccinate lyase